MSHRITTTAVGAILAAAATTALGACGPTEAVCEGAPARFTVLPFTSPSDLKLSRQLAPEVAQKVAARAASSCGEVAAGIVRSDPEATLVIRDDRLKSEHDQVPDRRAFVRQLEKDGLEFLEDTLLGPLENAKPSPGSPFLNALAKVAQEAEAHSWKRGTVVLIGDSVARERAPSGALIDFRREVPPGRLEEFVPLLRTLRGHCVMLLGQGGGALANSATLRRAREMLDATLSKAGVGFVATRSPELPPDCGAHG